MTATKQPELPLFSKQVSQMSEFSNYIVYVDESGDSNLTKIDVGYPIFILAFCIFYKKNYAKNLVPRIQNFKFKYFGHDMIILHEREVRKKITPFTFKNKKIEEEFILELSDILDESKFVLIATAIKKDKLSLGKSNQNAYHIALKFCLEQLYSFLSEKNQHNRKTFVVFEARGEKEDKELELEFRRICSGINRFNVVFPFEVLIKSKQTNSTGLQIADLVARPIGRKLIDNQMVENRAFRILEKKFYCKDSCNLGCHYYDYGLKVYP